MFFFYAHCLVYHANLLENKKDKVYPFTFLVCITSFVFSMWKRFYIMIYMSHYCLFLKEEFFYSILYDRSLRKTILKLPKYIFIFTVVGICLVISNGIVPSTRNSSYYNKLTILCLDLVTMNKH